MRTKVDRIKQLEATIRCLVEAMASSEEPWLRQAREIGKKVLADKPTYTCECGYCQNLAAWKDLG